MDLLVKIGIGTIFFIFILFIIGLIIYFAQPKTPLKQSPALIPAKTLITIPTSKVSTAIPTPINIPIITGSVTLKADNNKYCTDAGDKIICSKENLLGSWERFIIETIETPDNNYIALRGGKDGKYCSDEGDRIICNRDIIGGWEKFKIVNLSKDQTVKNNIVAIIGGKDGKYCTIKDGPMVCTSSNITQSEKFNVESSQADTSIIKGSATLKASNNKYCTDAGDKIICTKDGAPEQFEKFIIDILKTPENNYIALRGGKDGKYCADEGKRIICNRDIIGGWEKFKIMNLSKDQTADNNYVAIMGGYDGRYCTIKDGPMVCTSTVITDFEKFKIDKSL